MRWLAALALVVAACGDGAAPGAAETPTSTPITLSSGVPGSDGCADVVDATARQQADGSWTFEVTVSSADTGWDKYADSWEVRTAEGAVLSVRALTHPHENEQPFTRSLSGVLIPERVSQVIIAAHDSVAGFCGDTVKLGL